MKGKIMSIGIAISVCLAIMMGAEAGHQMRQVAYANPILAGDRDENIVLEGGNIAKEACISYLVNAQNPDGGFPFYLGEKSNLAGVCHALLGLDAVEALDKIDREACIKWISQLQDSDGGFSPSSGEDSNLWFTGLAVMSLTILDALNEMGEDSCIRFIQICQNPDGGFALRPGGMSNLMVTGLAVWTLHDMGEIEEIDQDNCRDFIVGCECPNGGFGVQPSGLMSGFRMLPSSGFAILSLNWLGGLDGIDKDSCANYIASCQERDGSFSMTPSPFMNGFMTCMMPMMPKLLTACPMMKKLPLMDMMTLMGGGGGMPPSAFNYFGVSSLKILNTLERMNLDAFIDFICQCQNPDGGFGGKPGTKSTTVDSGHSLMMLEELGTVVGLTLFPQSLSAEGDELLIYSGAGMKGPMDEIGELFEDKYDVEVEYIYAGSGDLLSQIESSEEGDVFMLGGMHYFELAKDEEFIEYEKYVAHHTPVIAVQEENPQHVDSIEDLARPGTRVALGDAGACAIGKVSEKILDNAEISDEVEENVEVYASTVNEAVLCVVEQEVDAAIVWMASLVEFEDETDMVEIAEEINEIDIIPIGTLIFSEDKTLAREFVDFVSSDEGKEVFEEWSFEPYS